ncbi:MAG: hypothetical protein H6705_21595, partial [Myxococcales bacterium]|nr:hypothetical protein [Myxococcales bacterium]
SVGVEPLPPTRKPIAPATAQPAADDEPPALRPIAPIGDTAAAGGAGDGEDPEDLPP